MQDENALKFKHGIGLFCESRVKSVVLAAAFGLFAVFEYIFAILQVSTGTSFILHRSLHGKNSAVYYSDGALVARGCRSLICIRLFDGCRSVFCINSLLSLSVLTGNDSFIP